MQNICKDCVTPLQDKNETLQLLNLAEDYFLTEIEELREKVKNSTNNISVLRVQQETKKLLSIYKDAIQVVDDEVF